MFLSGSGIGAVDQPDIVVSNLGQAGHMGKELPDGDGVPRLRQTFEIGRQGRIEIELASLNELNRRDASKRLADRVDREDRLVRYRHGRFEIGLPIGAGEDDPAILHDRELKSGNVARSHFGLHHRFNFALLVIDRPFRRLSGNCAGIESTNYCNHTDCSRNSVHHCFAGR